MRLVLILIVIVFLALGALLGALNAERITVDFYFAQLTAPKGALLLTAVAIGWLLGGLVASVARVRKLRRDHRTTQRRPREAPAEPRPPMDGRAEDA
jgi:uncharacterized integral membrane protein